MALASDVSETKLVFSHPARETNAEHRGAPKCVASTDPLAVVHFNAKDRHRAE